MFEIVGYFRYFVSFVKLFYTSFKKLWIQIRNRQVEI